MNRRSFIQAAALLPAVASQTRGTHFSLPPVLSHPVEVELSEPDAARHIGNPGTELYVRLEELFPGDPGQLSGISLRIMESGKFTVVSAEGASPQRDGSQLSHCYGWRYGAELPHVTDPTDDEAGFCVRLRELYPKISPESYSGVSLILFAGENPELRISFCNHCLGVLRGPLLSTFLECVRLRCEMETA